MDGFRRIYYVTFSSKIPFDVSSSVGFLFSIAQLNESWKKKVKAWYIEEVIIRTIEEYGLEGIRVKDYTGVWLDETPTQPKRKICAIGVHLSRWVTMHGFAFNVNTDLSHFGHIIPCGIDEKDKDVTSLEKELGFRVDVEEVKGKVKQHFAELFGFQYTTN